MSNDCLICLNNESNEDNKIILLKENKFIILFCDCNSYFHNDCLLQWIKKTNNCPICRKEIKYIKNDELNYMKYKYICYTSNRNDYIDNKFYKLIILCLLFFNILYFIYLFI